MPFMTQWRDMFSNRRIFTNSPIANIRLHLRHTTSQNRGKITFASEEFIWNHIFDDRRDKRNDLR